MPGLSLPPARNTFAIAGSSRLRRRARRWLSAAMSLVVMIGLAVVAVTVTAVPASADPTGTGGQFIPLQARMVDTRNGTGGFTGPMPAGVYKTFTVNGAVGLPSTGVAAVVATVTALNTTSSSGLLSTGANTGGSTGTATALLYEPTETVSNTVVIENGDDGKIKISSSLGIHILVDIQGYVDCTLSVPVGC